ncbi:VOC family protein [Streptosporangium carneum]|uniref:Lyase n=1 Tax=Streptosporangium carneum TaxID=47481 RepID=A0A9W6MDA8_9ACTN|nr:VOC family protein [Streptosporangium carneum]GLK10314.1 lyase [Streptosporangium carneum]
MIAEQFESPFSAVGRMVVLVDDLDAALAFYRDVLGFTVLHDQSVDGYRYLHVGLPGQRPVGLWLMPVADERERGLVGRQSGGQPLLVLYTDDLDRVGERLREHGVRVWNEQQDAASRSLHFADLYGNTLVAAEVRVPPSVSGS